jgi:hypothetical protein
MSIKYDEFIEDYFSNCDPEEREELGQEFVKEEGEE